MSGIDAEIPEAKSTLPEPETNVQQMRTQINGYNLPRFRKLVPFAFFFFAFQSFGGSVNMGGVTSA